MGNALGNSVFVKAVNTDAVGLPFVKYSISL